jgi:hypothetical protein
MFGRQDNQPAPQSDNQIADESINGALQADNSNGGQTVQPTNGDQDWQHPGTPLNAPTAGPVADTADEPQLPQTAPGHAPQIHPDSGAPASENGAANELIDIKQQALNQLSPLVGHLDQSPEEKFRTTMMMIQASDDQSLVPKAYEAAQAIMDEKVRAQALLDIVNEINYFTQHKNN